jgi:hypothetical protein
MDSAEQAKYFYAFCLIMEVDPASEMLCDVTEQ